jgi:hypothetical protein
MPRRLSSSRLVGGLLTLAAAGLAATMLVLLLAPTSAKDPVDAAQPSPSAPGAVDIAAGAIDVRIEPVRIDEAGAVFRVSFDTHSVDLDLDVAGSAVLEVDGVLWGDVTWVGDPPGGHHRGGELFFVGAGSADRAMVLRIAGLPSPVVAEWDLGG